MRCLLRRSDGAHRQPRPATGWARALLQIGGNPHAMPSNARPEDSERDETQPEGSKPPPRNSFFRLSAPRPALSDPRSPYTRALLNMVRVGDIVHLLTPTEILEAFCEAVAEPLALAAAVVIDAPDGLPRSIPWKANATDFRTLERAERRAWSNFAELLAPDLLSVLPP